MDCAVNLSQTHFDSCVIVFCVVPHKYIRIATRKLGMESVTFMLNTTTEVLDYDEIRGRSTEGKAVGTYCESDILQSGWDRSEMSLHRHLIQRFWQ